MKKPADPLEIKGTIDAAISRAKQNESAVVFQFNGVTVVVTDQSKSWLILRDWQRAMKGYLGKNATVGPHPKPELSLVENAVDTIFKEASKAANTSQQLKNLRARNAKLKLELESSFSLVREVELKNKSLLETIRRLEADRDFYKREEKSDEHLLEKSTSALNTLMNEKNELRSQLKTLVQMNDRLIGELEAAK